MKLKCLSLTVMTFLFLFVGCNKDAFFDEGSDTKLKSAELKMVPIKWDVNALITGFGLSNGRPVPVKGILEGTVSHLGELKEGSYWDAFRYVRHDDVNPPYIDYGMAGKFVAANGDELFYTTEGNMYTQGNEDGINWVATWNITGGTGRFENAGGEGEATGMLTRDENGIPVSVEMQMEGMISNVGRSK